MNSKTIKMSLCLKGLLFADIRKYTKSRVVRVNKETEKWKQGTEMRKVNSTKQQKSNAGTY